MKEYKPRSRCGRSRLGRACLCALVANWLVVQVLGCSARISGATAGSRGKTAGGGRTRQEAKGAAPKGQEGREGTPTEKRASQEEGAAAALFNFKRWPAQRRVGQDLHGCTQGQAFGNAPFPAVAGIMTCLMFPTARERWK